MRSRTARRRAHAAYIESPIWHARRDAYRAAAGNRCEVCGAAEPDVHHLEYRRGEYLRGRERDRDLMLLCRGHHDLAHDYEASGAWPDLRAATWAMAAAVTADRRARPPRRQGLRRVLTR